MSGDPRAAFAAPGGDPPPRGGGLPARGVRVDRRDAGGRAARRCAAGAAREPAQRLCTQPLPDRPRRVPARAGDARPRRARGAWRVPLASRSPTRAVVVRPRARLAAAQLRHRRRGRGTRRRGEVLAPVRRPCGVRRGTDMAVTVLIPTPLRPFVGGKDALELEGGNVGEVLDRLASAHGALRPHLFADDGRLRSFVNVYVNDRDIRQLAQRDTRVAAGDTVSIIPSIAGGTAVADVLPKLSHEEILRYSRHLILPDVGLEGQRKLKAARVLLIGAGGLGSPAALYLAAAGVGTLGIVDFDVVDKTNLQRQILHGTETLGMPKLESARRRIEDLNPNVQVETFETRLTSANALDILGEFDVVADGTDNFPTRYLVNDACVLLGKPNVYGSIFRFEGQASVFYAKEGPCYRCLYAEPPPPGLVPSCAEGGVLGVLPGIIGSIQAMETIKLIVGAGEPLIGRLLLFDALKLQFRELKLAKDPDCPVCGPRPSVTELIDYEAFCGIGAEPSYEGAEITAAELKAEWDRNPDLLVIDVREPHEYEIAHIDGAVLIPLGELPDRLGELDGHREVVTHCHHGARSLKALEILKAAGFSKVRSLRGGIDAWAVNVDPSLPRY